MINLYDFQRGKFMDFGDPTGSGVSESVEKSVEFVKDYFLSGNYTDVIELPNLNLTDAGDITNRLSDHDVRQWVVFDPKTGEKNYTLHIASRRVPPY